MSSPALDIDGGGQGGQETGEAETADPGGDGDVESIGPEAQEVEAEAPPPAARRPRHVAELAVFNTTARENDDCLLYTSPSPRDKRQSRMPSSA